MAHARIWFLRLGMLLLVAATATGWVAVGRLSAATVDALSTTEQTLVTAEEIAASCSEIAVELGDISSAIEAGLIDTAEALQATGEVSKNLRGALGFLERFSGSVDDLTDSLETAEASLVKVIADLGEAQGDVAAARPAIDAAAASLARVPGDITASRALVRDSIDELEQQVRLWRLTLVFAAASLGVLFVVIDGLVRRGRSAQP